MLENLVAKVEHEPFIDVFGCITKVRRDSIRVFVPGVQVGTLCEAKTKHGTAIFEIVSLDPDGHVAMPLDDLGSVQLGDKVRVIAQSASVPVGQALLGRVVNSLCIALDGGQPLLLGESMPLYGGLLNPMDRQLIHEPMDLGVGSLNACLACGRGQRQGIFAGSGIGKSVLLGMMARYTAADVVVISLIGERGREVREFIENELGPEGSKKSVVVVETADQSAVRRSRGAYTATAIAEYFKNRGANVLLMMDSLTRFAMAQREIGIAAGEPPTTRGYTPSVFAHVSKLIERAGNWGEAGSITGLYTVLVEGDDLDEPVSDNARAILDGHIVLSRKLANRGHYPPIDILSSVSRLMDKVVDDKHHKQAVRLKQILAKYQENEDAILYGMYVRGTDSAIDESIEMEPVINEFLRQDRGKKVSFAEAARQLGELVKTSS